MTDDDLIEREEITVTQHWLGFRPYVLIELKPAGDDTEDVILSFSMGGGVVAEDLGDIFELALQAVNDPESLAE